MWTPEEHKQKMSTLVGKFIDKLNGRGISVNLNAEKDNVEVSFEDRTARISQHSFYRYSGIACICRDKEGENNQSEAIDVTDEMYLNSIISPVIDLLLDIKKKK